MSKEVILSIRGQQSYEGQDQEVIELVTEGALERTESGWSITYEESDLTGLKGVVTTFAVEPGKIVLTRQGSLSSRMVFEEGVFHDSLYEMEFGALMLTVRAGKVAYEIDENGGSIDLQYSIEIENSAAGSITYHLDIRG